MQVGETTGSKHTKRGEEWLSFPYNAVRFWTIQTAIYDFKRSKYQIKFMSNVASLYS